MFLVKAPAAKRIDIHRWSSSETGDRLINMHGRSAGSGAESSVTVQPQSLLMTARNVTMLNRNTDWLTRDANLRYSSFLRNAESQNTATDIYTVI